MLHKKQLFTLFEDIATLNNDTWGNHKGSYDDTKESAYQIEEALEGISMPGNGGGLQTLANMLNSNVSYIVPVEETHKSVSRGIVDAAYFSNASDVDRFDKALDAMYFAVGSLHKLGLAPSQMVDGLQLVHDKNLEKSGTKDSAGKITKDVGFVGPEEGLQKILDKRTT